MAFLYATERRAYGHKHSPLHTLAAGTCSLLQSWYSSTSR